MKKWADSIEASAPLPLRANIETAEKEVQDISCRGSGGVPQLQKSPKIGGFRGLIKTIAAFSIG